MMDARFLTYAAKMQVATTYAARVSAADEYWHGVATDLSEYTKPFPIPGWSVPYE